MRATIRQRLISLTVIAILMMSVAEGFGQGPAAGQATPPALPSNVVKATRPYYVEGAVVGLLMAASVFAVVRSSRRV